MSAPRGWPFLAVSVFSATLLLVLTLVVALRDRPGSHPVVLPMGRTAQALQFPPGFGRLDALVPFSGGVAPVPAEVVTVEHAPEFREAEWVRAQNPDTYTIQVLAVRDEEAVKRFLAGREDRAQFVYFQFPQDGSLWFVVTTGSFATHDLAAGVAASKDFGGLAITPFPRRLSVYQQALEAAPAAAPAPAAPAAPPPAPQP